MDFETVFDLGYAGYRNWWYPAVGLFPFAAGALMAFAPRLAAKIMGPHVRGVAARMFGVVFFVFSAVWIGLAFANTYDEYRGLRRALEAGNYRSVEGVVRNFNPAPDSGGIESFEVSGVGFRLTPGLSPGYNRTRAEGGPIADGVYVRIAYLEPDILRLEIRK